MPTAPQRGRGTRRERYAKLGCLAFFLASAAAAQAPLTFDDSIALAVRNNPALYAARANLDAAQQRARAAFSGFLPEVSGSVNYVDRSGTAAQTVFSTATYSTGVTVTQNVFAGFQDQARVEQGAANVNSAQAALIGAKAQLSRDLKGAYAGLLYAQDNVILTESILRRLEENLRLVELRFESGRENKGALLLTQASVTQARFEQLQARQALATAQTQLAAVLGQSVAAPRASGTVPVSAPTDTPDFDALLRATPDLQDALARERAAAADIQLARAGFYPSVNVSGTIGRDGDNWFPSDDSRSIGASISIPIYSGGRDYYGVRASLAALESVQADRASVENEVLLRLQQTYAAYVEAVERLAVDRQFVNAVQTRAAIARARYENGLISFEDWDRAENDLIQRRKALLVSQRERVNAEAAWELAQGKGVIP